MSEEAQQSEDKDLDDQATPKRPVMLAIGASGAETGELSRVLLSLPYAARFIVVLALRDREVFDESQLRAALGSHAARLTIPEDGDAVREDHIYIAPKDMLLTVDRGSIRLRRFDEAQETRGAIDSLFVSLAQDQDSNTIGMVVGHIEGDGMLGLTAIKEAGGLTLAVDHPIHGELEHIHSMSSLAMADYILTAPELTERVALYIRHYHRLNEAAANDARSATEAEKLNQVAAILRNHTGHDFHGYKRATFMRRVQRRMQVVQADSAMAYIDVLRSQPDEAQQLFNDLLIGVTQFFRDKREFDFLEAHVVPKLFSGKGRGDQLRVWVLGCSTGEEAYSLAILLREHASTLEVAPQIQIFASDIDTRALAVARLGRYTDTVTQDVTPERLARWFIKEGNTYCVSKELREMCVFSQHSIVKDPPFSRLDLVSCRNLLIYLGAELQNRVIPVFHFALRPGGYLFLGSSENVSRHAKLFSPVERNVRIFQRIEAGTRLLSDFPLSPASPLPPNLSGVPRPRLPSQGIARFGERVAERFAPAYAIVDEHFEVLHFSARAGRYIHPAGGAPTLNLLNLVHRDLRLDLRSALNRASAEHQTVQVEGLQMNDERGLAYVNLIIEPAGDGDEVQRGFVVLFQDVPPPSGLDTVILGNNPSHDEHVQSLDTELRVTRERLQAMIEELESTNEELKSSNEEYQSLNEELQSANEELETSKEELQSVNEEVTTVNGELAHRVQELAHANSDLKNLLESTQIATVFLDNELRVTNFTPAVVDVFPLVESDIRRPISNIKSHVVYDELQDDVRRVIRTLGTIDREVENPQTKARYIVRVLPYRSVDNFIGGAVVTFMDVTPLTRAEQALRDSERRLRTLMEGIAQLVWRSLDGGHWTWCSPQWSAFTGQTEAESRDTGWLNAIHPDDRKATVEAWQSAMANGSFEVDHRIYSIAEKTYRWFHTLSMPVRDDQRQIIEWLGTSTNVDDLRRLQERQRVMVAELQHRTRNLIAVVQSIGTQALKEAQSMDAFQALFDDRLAALARVQVLLSQSDSGPVTIGALLDLELESLGRLKDRVLVNGRDISLRKSAVQTLSLALHELVTNSRKYGALATDLGELSVSWELDEEARNGPQLLFKWFERGFPPRTIEGDGDGLKGGYGRRLIEQALPYTLSADTTYELGSDSLYCTIRLPIKAKDEHGLD
ncbi:CheR family methyltransferase [Dyella jiangningensis]|uniref:Methyltransferase n=1 Tax=Dyella jiangningensis TaxID=1379159 RepID=A0A328P4R2_9GAMM|nr:CheR family methyltransferase [Dyella jiangningensis]RAO77258.1 methyltransferase [Dyella jiangningensis]